MHWSTLDLGHCICLTLVQQALLGGLSFRNHTNVWEAREGTLSFVLNGTQEWGLGVLIALQINILRDVVRQPGHCWPVAAPAQSLIVDCCNDEHTILGIFCKIEKNQVCLISQIQDGGAQPQFRYLSPYELSKILCIHECSPFLPWIKYTCARDGWCPASLNYFQSFLQGTVLLLPVNRKC